MNWKDKIKEKISETKHLQSLDWEWVLDDCESKADFGRKAEDFINEQEIIYNSKAMDFLAKHDPSLLESLGIAGNMGYTLDKLNSEILATILYQDLLRQELSDIL